MLPDTSSNGALIYTIGNGGNAYLYKYPGGQPVTEIALEFTINICSDLSGNVYITDTGGGSNGAIRIYSHGSTYTQDILAFDGYPGSCSVDAGTGNLAVTNNAASGSGDIGIYQNAEGSPTYYTATNMTHYISCAYDDQGNLFVDGNNGSSQVLDEMPQGSTDLVAVSLGKALKGAFGRLQWQGSYLAMGLGATNTIYHIKVSGSTGAITGKTRAAQVQSWWIQGDTLLSTYGNRSSKIAFWKYPKGGKPYVTTKAHASLAALTVSVAPSRQRESNEKLRFCPLRAMQLRGCGNARRLRRFAAADRRAGRDAAKPCDRHAA